MKSQIWTKMHKPPCAWQKPTCWWEHAVAKLELKSFPWIQDPLFHQNLLPQPCLSKVCSLLLVRATAGCLLLQKGGLPEAWWLLRDLGLWISVMFLFGSIVLRWISLSNFSVIFWVLVQSKTYHSDMAVLLLLGVESLLCHFFHVMESSDTQLLIPWLVPDVERHRVIKTCHQMALWCNVAKNLRSSCSTTVL